MEENKLIAEFMGVKPTILGDEITYEMYGAIDCIEDGLDEQHFFLEEQLLFHTSWDWLMPVVEKIESLGLVCFEKNLQEEGDYQAIFTKGYDILICHYADKSIDATYMAVVEFIKTYNHER